MAMNLNMAGGAQGMMKEGSTLADGVDEAVLKNIGGALAASFIIFALFALASRATSTSRRGATCHAIDAMPHAARTGSGKGY